MKKSESHRPKSWRESKGAESRVLELLQESGALLETHLAEVCQQFVENQDRKSGIRATTESITYGHDTEESPLRQIDQCVSLYKEFGLDDRTGVQLHLRIPIEAKYRKDVECFGIPYPLGSYRPRFPLIGFVHGSSLSATLRSIKAFETIPLTNPILLQIDDSTPKKVHEENLLFNAAGALYDFIRFDFSSEESTTDDLRGRTIREMGLHDRFNKYLEETRYGWFSVVRSWMKENIGEVLVDEFNRRVQGSGRVFQDLTAHVPAVCLNGDVWVKGSKGIEPSQSLLTRTRPRSWPGKFRRFLIGYTTEAPLLVTNIANIGAVFLEARAWFLALENALKTADGAVKKRWAIESAFHRIVLEEYATEYPGSQLRSDLDVLEWL